MKLSQGFGPISPWIKINLNVYEIGALGKIRTPDPQIRSLVLYPAELRVLNQWPFIDWPHLQNLADAFRNA